MQIIPALDLRNGGVVRLHQGDYDIETRYGANALERSLEYAAAGARWMHLVDLDAARAGRFVNLDVVETIAASAALSLQAGGGVRSGEDIARLLGAGVSRVVIGSLAVTEPDRVCEWIEHWGAERICVALDAREDSEGTWQLPVWGWTRNSQWTLDAAIDFYAEKGLRHVLCTDIGRDGTLAGPNAGLYRRLKLRAPSLCLQASGGVSALADLAALQESGVSGVIVGRALLDGRFTLAQALAC